MRTLTSDRPALMLVSDRLRVGGFLAFIDVAARAVEAGVDLVQVREKDLSSADLRSSLPALIDVIGRRTIVVNTDSEAALDLGLGVHLTESSPRLSTDQLARLDPEALVGRSIHTPPDGRHDSLSYLLFGHVFPSRSKPGIPPKGLASLQLAVSATTCPVLAIGGITAANAGDAIARGASGVAVIGEILDAPDIAVAARRLRESIDRAAFFSSIEGAL